MRRAQPPKFAIHHPDQETTPVNIRPKDTIFSAGHCTARFLRLERNGLVLMITLGRASWVKIETSLGINCQVDVPDNSPALSVRSSVQTKDDGVRTLTTRITTTPAVDAKSLTAIVQIAANDRSQQLSGPEKEGEDPYFIKIHTAVGLKRERVTYGISEISADGIACECLQTVTVEGSVD